MPDLETTIAKLADAFTRDILVALRGSSLVVREFFLTDPIEYLVGQRMYKP